MAGSEFGVIREDLLKTIGRLYLMVMVALGLLALPAVAHAERATSALAPAVAPAPESMAIMERVVTVNEIGIQVSCRVKPKYPSIGLAIRYNKSTTSTQIGRIYGSTSIPAKCYSDPGGSYRCRSWQGVRSWWIQVYYKGTWTHRWVAGYCSIWYRV
jgi:hypothetical protein